jgi:16S rRNA (adenine1518-N6/adenine1519-N6)-dimethyltransferase
MENQSINIDNHIARKRFGQNFLENQAIINNILQIIAPNITDHFIEIGPGKGALTEYFIDKVSSLKVIELDKDLANHLKHKYRNKQIIIYQDDALKFDFTKLATTKQKLRIVGNLPYNISTPLLFHLLEHRHIIKDMHFMLQKEVVLRLCAQPKQKNYGRLSVMCNYFCDALMMLDVPPEAFNPQPKVDSAIVRLTIKENIPNKAKDLKLFAHIVKTAFSQRRKIISNTLKTIFTLEDFNKLNINYKSRAEELRVSDYIALANYQYNKRNNK